jgi:dipeptidyl aminopeptidase/acylaminoacyl peptidase
MLAGVVLFATAKMVVAATDVGPSHVFEGRDIFNLQWVEDPQIRPDGRAIAYVRMSYDIMADRPRSTLWLVDTETGLQTPIATGPGSHLAPRWSPDGKRLAYVSSSEGGHSQIFVRWMQTGEAARVTDLTQAPSELAWSPDGRSIAFIMLVPEQKPRLGSAPEKPDGATWAEPLTVITDVTYRVDGEGYLTPGYTHAFVVSADGGSPRQLTFGPYNEDGPLSWTTDSHSVLLSGNHNDNWRLDRVTSQIYRVAVADGAVTTLVNRPGPYQEARVAPDGSKIAYLGYDDRRLGYQNVRLYIMDRDGNDTRSLTDNLDRTVESMQWAADSRSLYIRYTDKAGMKVARLSLNGRLEPVAEGLAGGELDRPYTNGGQFSVAANGAVAFASGDPTHPADLAITRGGHVTRLTRLNDMLLTQTKLGEVKPLAVSSSFDKRPIDAWMVLPPSFAAGKKYPLILEIHGGPFASYGALFSTDDQLYAAAGYVVVYANPRGSTSYGEEFANLIDRDYPGHDYDDLMSVVDAAVATGSVDPDELFVTGGSGGGVLTAWIVGKTHRFRAAVTQKPVINWASFSLTTDIVTFVPRYWFSKLPWEDPQGYWQRSPLSLVGNVTTPTLVVVGDQDFRTPVSDAEQYYEALKLRGIPTALVKVPGASHGGLAARPSQSAAKASAILEWYQRYRVSPRAHD